MISHFQIKLIKSKLNDPHLYVSLFDSIGPTRLDTLYYRSDADRYMTFTGRCSAQAAHVVKTSTLMRKKVSSLISTTCDLQDFRTKTLDLNEVFWNLVEPDLKLWSISRYYEIYTTIEYMDSRQAAYL